MKRLRNDQGRRPATPGGVIPGTVNSSAAVSRIRATSPRRPREGSAGRVKLGRNFRLRCRCAHTRYAAAVAKPDSASPLGRIAGRLVAVRPSKPDGVGETVFEVPFADQGKSRNAMKVSRRAAAICRTVSAGACRSLQLRDNIGRRIRPDDRVGCDPASPPRHCTGPFFLDPNKMCLPRQVRSRRPRKLLAPPRTLRSKASELNACGPPGSGVRVPSRRVDDRGIDAALVHQPDRLGRSKNASPANATGCSAAPGPTCGPARRRSACDGS